MPATFHASVIAEVDSSTTLTVTLAITAGDSVAVVGAWGAASVTPTIKITDNTALPMIVGPTTDTQGTEKFGVWLLQSAGTGNSSVTVTFSATVNFSVFYCYSFSGLTSPVLDQSAQASPAPATVTTGTLTSADEFAIEFAIANGAITAIGAPWTSDGISVFNSWGGGHRVVAATTALTSNFTGGDDSFIFTFKAGAGAALPLMGQIWL